VIQSTLVLLAAGMGSRYGGLKQLEPVGPHGETLMDYSIYDALGAGFGRVVFVIRPEIEDAFQRTVGDRYRDRIGVGVVHQRLDDLPEGVVAPLARRKPWGTGQALLAVRGVVEGPFAVANADDFYGRPAFEALAAFLAEEMPGKPVHAVVGYELWRTLSFSGAVNRALLRADADGWLSGIEEVFDIAADPGGGGKGTVAGRSVILEGGDLVSMNLWGFRPSVFEPLAQGFRGFLTSPGSVDTEYYLPTAIQALILTGQARVRVLAPDSPWCGLSHAADLPAAKKTIMGQIAQGVYPERLWK
jgi:hypothetical protein